jgi:hypothetical protein
MFPNGGPEVGLGVGDGVGLPAVVGSFTGDAGAGEGVALA